MKEVLEKSDFKKLVISGNKTTRRKFKEEFKTEINQFIDAIYEAYKLFKVVSEQWKNTVRNGFIEAYLHNAIDKLVISVNLLVSGYFVPSGNLVRQFCESCCMAILLSSKELEYFEIFKKHVDDKTTNQIRANRSCYLIEENQDKIGINKKGWEAFLELRNFYNRLSHPSVFALATIKDISKDGGVRKFGAHFDTGKIPAYKKELKYRIVTIKYLKDIIEGIDQQTDKAIN